MKKLLLILSIGLALPGVAKAGTVVTPNVTMVSRDVALGSRNLAAATAPIRFDLLRYRDTADTPLFFPGKVLADGTGNRLFIADSTHHRVVVTSLEGEKKLIAGSGTPGFKDGPIADAQFDDPQGLALDGETLYVADRKNHLIRALDLKAGTVRTVAGVGRQDRESRHGGGPALKIGLNSPWDLLRIGRTLYVVSTEGDHAYFFDEGGNGLVFDPMTNDWSELPPAPWMRTTASPRVPAVLLRSRPRPME